MRKIIYAIMLGAIISCSNVDLPKVGETTSVNSECFAATSKEAYKELTKACNEKDEVKVKAMMRMGLVKYMYSFQDVVVKHHHSGFLEVEHDGKTYFVKADNFARKK